MDKEKFKKVFTIAAVGTASLGIIGFIAEPACVTSAVTKGLANLLNIAAEKVMALTP